MRKSRAPRRLLRPFSWLSPTLSSLPSSWKFGPRHRSAPLPAKVYAAFRLPRESNSIRRESIAAPISLSAYVCTGTAKVVAEHLPALHDELHALELGDIVRRIAGDGDEIGILAFLDGADPVAPADV